MATYVIKNKGKGLLTGISGSDLHKLSSSGGQIIDDEYQFVYSNTGNINIEDISFGGISAHGKNVIFDNSISDTTIIVTENTVENFITKIKRIGSGKLTFSEGAGVTIISPSGSMSIALNESAILQRIGSTNTYILDA